MEDKEWTWLWGATGHTEFAVGIKEIQGGPRDQHQAAERRLKLEIEEETPS